MPKSNKGTPQAFASERCPFDLSGRVAIITGGAGFLGEQHAHAVASIGASPVLVDLDMPSAERKAEECMKRFGVRALAIKADITKPEQVKRILKQTLKHFGRVDVLVNNAAKNPKVESPSEATFSRLENFSLAQWESELAVGLTGAFLCSQSIGAKMAEMKGGVILNIASDLAVIAPDQRIYRKENLPEDRQPVKPVTYSVIKTGILGLTRYLATYWAEKKVRVNALSMGGVFNNQPRDFLTKLTNLIPLGRMANRDEYKGAIQFLCSDASSYMTGQNLIIDGGRSSW